MQALAAAIWDQPADRGRVIRDVWSPPLAGPRPDLYPDYATTARVLAALGVPPDFEADGGLRYLHRREGSSGDLFHRQPGKIVRGRSSRDSPRRRPAAGMGGIPSPGSSCRHRDFKIEGGLTIVPLKFEPYESAFVVFRRPVEAPGKAGSNVSTPAVALTVSGPWEVAFDPKRGGPAQTTFAALTDWSQSTQAGIRFYSGQATYRTKFRAPALAADRASWLDLGRVAVMARVRLNGRDLGVAWCQPFRVAVPAGLLRAGDNDLEITVANLWINRLTGDAGLPSDQRRTWTTWNPFFCPIRHCRSRACSAPLPC